MPGDSLRLGGLAASSPRAHALSRTNRRKLAHALIISSWLTATREVAYLTVPFAFVALIAPTRRSC